METYRFADMRQPVFSFAAVRSTHSLATPKVESSDGSHRGKAQVAEGHAVAAFRVAALA